MTEKLVIMHMKSIVRVCFLAQCLISWVCAAPAREDQPDAQPTDQAYVDPAENLQALQKGLLLSPYPGRSALRPLYGKPVSTGTIAPGFIVDTHAPAKNVIIRTYWRAENIEEYNALEWCEILVDGTSGVPTPPWRFSWPGPIIDPAFVKRKTAVLMGLGKKLVEQSRTLEKTEEFDNGKLQRKFRIKEHFQFPVGKETWLRKGVVVAKGYYRNHQPWNGTFLKEIGGENVFRELTYVNGVLLYSTLPSWEEENDSLLSDITLVNGPAANTALDEEAFTTNKKVLELARAPRFLEWATQAKITEGYRIVVCPSFTPAIVFNLKLKSETGDPSLEWAVIGGQAGYSDTISQVIRRQSKKLDPKEVRELREIVSKSLFWTQRKEISPLVLDGWSLYYEGIQDGRYAYRHYSNPDAATAEALACRLLREIPAKLQAPASAQPFDEYLANLRECMSGAVRTLEHTGHRDMVDELLLHPSPGALARCIRTAQPLIPEALKAPGLRADFNSLHWDSKSGSVIHPDGSRITLTSKKEVAIWDNSWMYHLILQREGHTDDHFELTVKLTPAATVALYKATSQPPKPTAAALKILNELNLNPDDATVIDWGGMSAPSSSDEIEKILVLPPAKLPGGQSHLVTINHTKHSHQVQSAGGFYSENATAGTIF